MSKISGIPVILRQKSQSGTDPFGAPEFSWTEVVIENVLISPVSSEDQLSILNLTGEKVVYELAIPKGDTHNWEDAEVFFFGEWFRTLGDAVQGLEHMIPLNWNKKVKVERVERGV